MGDENKSGTGDAAGGKNTDPKTLDKGRRKATAAPEVPDLMTMVMGGLESGDDKSGERKADKPAKAKASADDDAGDDNDDGQDGGDEGDKSKRGSRKADKPAKAEADENDDDQGGDSDEDDAGRSAAGDDDDDKGEGEDDENSDAGKSGDEDEPYAEDLKKLAGETKQFVALKLKDLPPETRKQVEGVIGARVAKVLATERTERDRLSSQVAEMTTEFEAAQRAKGPPVIAGIHPALLAETEAEIDAQEDKIQEALDWAEDHADGYNLPDSDDHDPKQGSMTAEQIRQRARALRRERDRIIPQARESLKKRTEHEAPLKKVFPAMFDPKTVEYRQAHLILKDQPWLRQFADFRVRVARQILGERALAGLLKAKPDANAKGDKGKHEADEGRKAPRLPGSGGPAKGGSGGHKPAGSGATLGKGNFGRDGDFSQDALTRDLAAVLPR